MKRFILSLTAAAVLSMPMAASALDKMDNNQLKSSTGQAGVSIAIDDVVIYNTSVADVTYWDNDGAGDAEQMGTDAAAGIMLDYNDNYEKITTIDGITNLDGDFSVYGVSAIASAFDDIDGAIGVADVTDTSSDDYVAIDPTNGNVSNDPGNFVTGISPLTIDVGTCEALTEGWDYNNTIKDSGLSNKPVAGVVIGLPTIEIATYSQNDFQSVKLRTGSDNGDGSITSDDYNEELSSEDNAGLGSAMNTTKNTFITIEKSGVSKMAILGGRLEIAPH